MRRPTLQILENMIEYTSLRQKSINKNIANVTTDNYQREDISFEAIMSREVGDVMKTTRSNHLLPNTPSNDNSFVTTVDKNFDDNSGKNNVVMEQEMAELAENAMLFKFAAKRLNSYFSGLQSVIKGGSR